MRAPLAALALLLAPLTGASAQASEAPARPAWPPPNVEVQSPGEGMMEQPCPAQEGLWFGHPWILANDWAWMCRYRADNQRVLQSGQRPDVVFIGDSITEGWARIDAGYFGTSRIGRGIGGQTSPQILLRFSQDVVALRPRVVHIMIGTNDIAGNTGPNSPQAWQDNIRAMVAIARANGIAVILGSIPPADRFDWRPALTPAPRIAELNRWLRDYAATEHLTYADYHSALTTPAGALDPAYGTDGVHPDARGYAVMRPIADRAIAQALRRQ